MQASDASWATALAIVFLQQRFAAQIDEWQLIMEKAIAYLTHSNAVELVELARAFLAARK